MHPLFRILAVTVSLLAIWPSARASEPTAFVVPIETEIDMAAWRHFRQACRQAHEANADIMVLKLNTYGGELAAADSIRTLLLRQSMPTVAFVDVNAASAGALIALACDSVFMAPGASMGAATVVNGAGEPMPRKYQSYMETIMRSTAEHHGIGPDGTPRRDPALAENMVNPEQALSFTPLQAIEAGYAQGQATSVDAVLAQLGMPHCNLQYYQSSLSDDILGFLANSAVRAVLVMLILGGLYMEMRTSGIGFAGAVAVVAAVLYFLPMLVVGSVPAWVLLCFIGGVVLIALEVFVVPGFGVTGVCGIIAVVASLAGGAAAGDSISGIDITGIGNALITIGIGASLAIALILYLTSRHGPVFFRRHSELMKELKVSDGFIGVDMEPAKLVGKTARTVTDMRPAGKIEIDGEVYDAVSTGEFIAAGKTVDIVKYENAQLYVK